VLPSSTATPNYAAAGGTTDASSSLTRNPYASNPVASSTNGYSGWGAAPTYPTTAAGSGWGSSDPSPSAQGYVAANPPSGGTAGWNYPDTASGGVTPSGYQAAAGTTTNGDPGYGSPTYGTGSWGASGSGGTMTPQSGYYDTGAPSSAAGMGTAGGSSAYPPAGSSSAYPAAPSYGSTPSAGTSGWGTAPSASSANPNQPAYPSTDTARPPAAASGAATGSGYSYPPRGSAGGSETWPATLSSSWQPSSAEATSGGFGPAPGDWNADSRSDNPAYGPAGGSSDWGGERTSNPWAEQPPSGETQQPWESTPLPQPGAAAGGGARLGSAPDSRLDTWPGAGGASQPLPPESSAAQPTDGFGDSPAPSRPAGRYRPGSTGGYLPGGGSSYPSRPAGTSSLPTGESGSATGTLGADRSGYFPGTTSPGSDWSRSSTGTFTR
jgi:nuclear pore complex protein Nup62